jgi:uncharacterized membrane-anchored protein YitT (DUF2179 family)
MMVKKSPVNFNRTWKVVQDYLLVILGASVQALAMRLFLIPALLTSGGVSGLAQIINFLFNLPVGVLTFAGNLPLFIIGWRYLGGRRFALRTLVAISAFSFFTDFLTPYVPKNDLTTDLFLNTIYGGVLLGVGLGVVYRGRGTSGGTDIICRMMNRYLGIPISTGFLLADGLVVAASGYFFGWDHALYGLVVIYVSGLTAEMVSEGSAVFRAAMIITNQADAIAEKIHTVLSRGATILPGTGSYTGQPRPVLYCVVTRAEVNQLKSLVSETDPMAFMVIGQAHETLGEGFTSLQETQRH